MIEWVRSIVTDRWLWQKPHAATLIHLKDGSECILHGFVDQTNTLFTAIKSPKTLGYKNVGQKLYLNKCISLNQFKERIDCNIDSNYNCVYNNCFTVANQCKRQAGNAYAHLEVVFAAFVAGICAGVVAHTVYKSAKYIQEMTEGLLYRLAKKYDWHYNFTILGRVVSKVVSVCIEVGCAAISTVGGAWLAVTFGAKLGVVAGPLGMLVGAGVGLTAYAICRWFW